MDADNWITLFLACFYEGFSIMLIMSVILSITDFEDGSLLDWDRNK